MSDKQNEQLTLDPKKLSKDEMQRALELLQKENERKAKIARGEIKSQKWSDLTPEQKAQRNISARRRNAKIALLCQKAADAGIKVTDTEIDAYLAGK